ncbi:MAG: HAD family hydrolase [Candidatus Bipolaricaulia bacterium]
MISRAQIVTDVDNTILRAERRLWRVLRDLGWEESFPQLEGDYEGAKGLPNPELFYRLFLSERYLELDEPLPGAAATLRALKEAGHRIVYLTGRHDAPDDSMRRGTARWLAEHGFPHPGDGSTLLWMKPKRGLDDRRFKEEALEEILQLGPVRAGIGDRPSDGEAYLRRGVPAILLRNGRCPLDGLRALKGEVLIVHDWSELAGLLLGEGEFDSRGGGG